MLVAESRLGRRLIGRLDRGTDLLEGLAEVCRTHGVRAGELRALGALEQAVVGEYDQRTRAPRPPRRFDAQFEIVSLYGNVSEREGKLFVRAGVTLSRERDNGIELIGGQLVSGRVFAVEFVIETFDDLILRRMADAATGLPLWREAVSLATPGAPAPVAAPAPAAIPFEAPARGRVVDEKPSWQDVVAASAAAEAPTRELPDRVVSSGEEPAKAVPGDLIDHPKFGRLQVERVEGDYEFVSARLRNQRLIRLSLDVLTLTLVGHEDGRQLFRAEPSR
jgi:predicted DNA-binding protein with PD1-like motif